MVLIHTDLPEPVEPATNRWGILDRSARIDVPIISLPSATRILFAPLFCQVASSTSLKPTEDISRFGISIPIVFLPGIGACIRTSFAAIAKAISLLIPTILLTFVPLGTIISYSVTAGPI